MGALISLSLRSRQPKEFSRLFFFCLKCIYSFFFLNNALMRFITNGLFFLLCRDLSQVTRAARCSSPVHCQFCINSSPKARRLIVIYRSSSSSFRIYYYFFRITAMTRRDFVFVTKDRVPFVWHSYVYTCGMNAATILHAPCVYVYSAAT